MLMKGEFGSVEGGELQSTQPLGKESMSNDIS